MCRNVYPKRLQLGRIAEILLVFRGTATVLAHVGRIFHQLFYFFQIILQLTDMFVMPFSTFPHATILLLSIDVSSLPVQG